MNTIQHNHHQLPPLTVIINFTLCLLSILNISSSVNIDCRFAIHNYYIHKRIYSCIIKTVTSPEYQDAYVTGNHAARSSSEDVRGIFGNIGNVHKFPKGLEKYFPNLQIIHFNNGQIKELVAEDLKPFPELMELYFERNKIEVIEEGTFDFNPKLAGISFLSNKLFHIHQNVFDNLLNLNNLWLNGNVQCPNSAAINNRNGVLNIISTAKLTCQSAAFLRLQNQVKEVCPKLPAPTLLPPTVPATPYTTAKSCPSAQPSQKCPKCNTKCQNIDEIFNEYSNEIVDIKAECGTSESQAYKSKIEDFEIDFGNMHSEFSYTLHIKFENLKNEPNTYQGYSIVKVEDRS
ncbi:uncharacterized protein [Chironomus tepperi]|uniref:uncharacterized protein n=1 Tax=Chironomus tepperi TaxID=113505 RepID=UPI00391FA5B0